jgi:hypothetical protein
MRKNDQNSSGILGEDEDNVAEPPNFGAQQLAEK